MVFFILYLLRILIKIYELRNKAFYSYIQKHYKITRIYRIFTLQLV